MPKHSSFYISIMPTTNSRLSLDDSKELIDYLLKTQTGPVKLITKSQSRQGLSIYLGASSHSLERLINYLYTLSPNSLITTVKTIDVDIKSPTLELSYLLNKHYSYPLYDVSRDVYQAFFKFKRSLVNLKDKEAIEICLIAQPKKILSAFFLRRQLITGGSLPISSISPFGIIVNWFWQLANSLAKLAKLLLKLSITYKQSATNGQLKIIEPKTVAVLDKLFEPLFKVDLTVKIKASSQQRAYIIAQDFELALNKLAKNIGYQQFTLKHQPTRQNIYSLSDLSVFFNFDNHEIKENLFQSKLIKTLPNQKPQKKLNPGDVIIGHNTYQGTTSNLVLSLPERYRHTYISGATGCGKSTLLANMITQDIASGQGVSLIDPHGDLANEVLKFIPAWRQADVIYFDPSDMTSSLRINLLQINCQISSQQFKSEADRVTESVISLFRKIFSEDINGHRIEYILRNTIQTSLLIPNSTMFTIYSLLTDYKFRNEVIKRLHNKYLINFWQNEIGRAGDFQRVKMTAGVTAKLGRFLFSEPVKRVFAFANSTIDFNQLMDERKILICNFAKGQLGEDNTRLFAASIMSKLQLAALARASKPISQRVDHFMYVDEFQSYSPNILIQLLSEARKYGLYLTMAEQSPSQQDSVFTSQILTNVANLICFRTASPKDEQLLSSYFKDYINSADLANLAAFNFFIKSSAIQAWPPTTGQTLKPVIATKQLNMLFNDKKQGVLVGL